MKRSSSRYVVLIVVGVLLWRKPEVVKEHPSRPSSSACCDVNLKAVIDLAKRYIPSDLVDSNIKFEVLSSFCTSEDPDHHHDMFEYESSSSPSSSPSSSGGSQSIIIRGSSTPALTAGLGWYLKYEAKMHLSWTGDQLNFTQFTNEQLPLPTNKVRKSRQGKYSYYSNVCTMSYSFVWWTMERWYRELDWMALSGINMPLSFIGQEIIWLEVFKELGLAEQDILNWLGGPAFMAWQRMGNIQNWGGPMPMEWITQQNKLQKAILKRARELGMIPVLPAFGGFVPPELTTIFPEANVILSDKWLSFDDKYTPVHLVEVTDPLFQQIGSLFIKKLTGMYGTDHYYNADTFNEMTPSSRDLDYLTSAGRAVSSSIQSADPKGVWVMQGWLFNNAGFWTNERIEAYLSSPSDDGLLILDLQSEAAPHYTHTESYFGRPFLYSMLHNFGGNYGLFGKMQVISSQPPKLFENDSNSTIAGIGLTMEGINQNSVVYDLMTEMSWRNETPNLQDWVQEFALRRYGGTNVYIKMAWLQLSNTVYTCRTSQRGVTKSLAVKRPGMRLLHNGFMPTELFYDPDDLVIAWSYLLRGYSDSIYIDTYRYDLIDVTRQVLSNLLIPTYTNMLQAFGSKQTFEFQVHSTRFLDLLDDMDTIVSSSEHFLLERWLSSARSLAGNDTKLADFYEFNARNQITLWGPKGEINDYASKQYGGLISTYYGSRWKLFIRFLKAALSESTGFNEDRFNAECLKLEQAWQHGTERHPYHPSGDPFGLSMELYAKYKDLLLAIPKDGKVLNGVLA